HLLRHHLDAHADAVARVVVHAPGVAAAVVFVGHVVGAGVAGIAGITTAHRLGIADAHGRLAFVAAALVLVVDLAPGDAADHRAHRGRGEPAAAAADVTAQHCADDATGDGRHRTAGVVAVGATTITIV